MVAMTATGADSGEFAEPDVCRPPRCKPELLAPAGSPEAFVAALEAGADAVYLGLEAFNARHGAQNFTLEQLRSACRMAHLAGRRVYLTLNILVGSAEMGSAIELVADAYRAGIDAVIVQDIGLLARLRARIPQLEVHASTQMNLHNHAGVELARRLGARRVTLARELSLRELADLARDGVDLEVFGHGALCVCYSGQCLMSSLIGRRSANRGRCAQPCRLSWELVSGWPSVPGSPRDGGSVSPLDVPGEHLLSPKDLCTVDLLPELIDAGVASLKVEGRMKSASYVFAVCSVYRSCIDRAFDHPETYAVRAEERARLEEAFSRGFTTAYLEGERGSAMMSFKRANNRGVAVGRVDAISSGKVGLALSRPVCRGDVLEFWTSRGQRTLTVEDLEVGGRQSDRASSDQRPRLVVPFPVAPGDRVFRVRNELAERETSTRIAAYRGVPVFLKFTVEVHIGEPLRIRVTDSEGRVGAAEGQVCEPARTKAIGRQEIAEHVGRLGNTPYEVSSFDISLDEGAGLGFSQLHRVRTAAIEDYERRILQPWTDRLDEPAATDARDVGTNPSRSDVGDLLEVAVLSGDARVLAACREAGADVVYLPYEACGDDAALAAAGPSALLLLPNVIHDADRPSVSARACSWAAGVVADDIASVSALAARGVSVEAGPHCNVFNVDAAHVCETLGASRIWLSPELSLTDLGALSTSQTLPHTITVFGRQELMVTEHCVISAQGGCRHDCANCPLRARRHALRDRKGYAFPVTSDLWGRGHVWNSVVLDSTPQIPALAARGTSRFVVDARLLDASSAAEAVRRARAAVRAARAGAVSAPFDKLPSTTTGHLFRGVL